MVQNIWRRIMLVLTIFRLALRWGQSFPIHWSQEKKSGWVWIRNNCVSRRKLYLRGVGFNPAMPCPPPVPASWLHFFRTSRAFSFLISFASSPISRQYSLNLSSESWFTSKLFIFSSKEPASWGDTTANSGVRNGCFDTGRQGRLAGHYSLPSKSTRTTPSTFWTKLQPQHGTAWCPSPGGSKGWK